MAEVNFGIQGFDPSAQLSKGFNYADQISQSAAKYQAGAKFAQGDYSGAAQTQAQAGDIPQAQETQQFGQQAAQKGQQYIAQALPVFQQIAQAHANDPDKGAAALGAAFDHIAPEAQALTGANPQAMATFRQALVTDPAGTIARFQQQVPVEYKTAGDTLFQFRNGVNTGTFEGQKNIVAPLGSSIYQTGGGPNAAPAPSAQPQPAPNAPQGTPSESDVQGYITKNIPGAIITSGQRTPDHNAAVGGVPDSMHLNGQAVDFVMPKGMSFDQVQQMVAQSGLQPTELLNEGSHVHLAWGPKNGVQIASNSPTLPQGAVPQAPPAVTAQPQPAGNVRTIVQGQPIWRAPTPEELKQYPGATQMNAATGEAKYPPLSAIGASMTPDQLQPLVDIVKAGGTLPQRAMSNPAVYSNILKLAKEQGVDPEGFLANQANRKATQSTFQQVNTRYAMVQTQEQAFQNSLNLAYGLAQKAGAQGGGTLINSFRNYVKTGVVGDPSTGAFINAVNTAMNEYGKIIEGSTGNAGSSISARADANQMLSGADNLPAFVAKMQVLQQDAGYKIGALKDQHDTLMQTLKTIGQDSPDKSGDGIPTMSPIEASKAAPGTKFKGTDGVVRIRK